MIRFFIVEDNILFREGLRSLLDFSHDFECVGEYDSGCQAIADAPFLLPEVILMDIDLPGINGIECTRQLKNNDATSHIHIIMLTVLEDEYKVLEAIIAGATGYLLKSSSPEHIMDAVRQVNSGGSPMSPSIARKVFQLVKLGNPSLREKIVLNNREVDVLTGLVEGLTYKMIGEKYFIAVDTVRTYIRSIYEKLQVHSRSEAIVKAVKYKLV